MINCDGVLSKTLFECVSCILLSSGTNTQTIKMVYILHSTIDSTMAKKTIALYSCDGDLFSWMDSVLTGMFLNENNVLILVFKRKFQPCKAQTWYFQVAQPRW